MQLCVSRGFVETEKIMNLFGYHLKSFIALFCKYGKFYSWFYVWKEAKCRLDRKPADLE